jgi:hypothetical protein
VQWDLATVTQHFVAMGKEPINPYLESLNGGVHIARGSPTRNLLSQNMPRLDGLPQAQLNAFNRNGSMTRKSELHEGLQPRFIEGISAESEFVEDFSKVRFNIERQHKPVM